MKDLKEKLREIVEKHALEFTPCVESIDESEFEDIITEILELFKDELRKEKK